MFNHKFALSCLAALAAVVSLARPADATVGVPGAPTSGVTANVSSSAQVLDTPITCGSLIFFYKQQMTIRDEENGQVASGMFPVEALYTAGHKSAAFLTTCTGSDGNSYAVYCLGAGCL